MRRLRLSVPLLLLGLVAALGVFASQFRLELAGAKTLAPLTDRIATLTGYQLSSLGAIELSLLPRPHLRLQQPRLIDAQGHQLFAAPEAVIELNALALLTAQLIPDKFLARQAQIELDIVDVQRHLRWQEQTATKDFDALHPLNLDFSDSDFHVIDTTRHLDIKLGSASLHADWPSPQGPLSAQLRGTVENEPITGNIWLAQPVELFQSGTSALLTHWRGGSGNLHMNGRLTGGKYPSYYGKVDLAVEDVHRLSSLSPFLSIFADLPIQKFQLQTEMNLKPSVTTLASLQMMIDDCRMEGVIGWQEQTPADTRLTGTLAAQSLYLDDDFFAWILRPFESLGVAQTAGGQGERLWPQIDLRISAAEARIKTLQMKEVAIEISALENHASAQIIDAESYGGHISADIGVAMADPAAPHYYLSGSATNIDLDQFCRDMSCPWPTSGQADIEVKGRSTSAGPRPVELMTKPSGTVNLRLVNGTIDAFDIDQALRRLQRAPPAETFEIRPGQTSYQAMAADVDFENGIGTIRSGELLGPALKIGFSGQIDLGDGQIDIQAQAQQAISEGSTPPLPLLFSLHGPWRSATIKVDPKNFSQ